MIPCFFVFLPKNHIIVGKAEESKERIRYTSMNSKWISSSFNAKNETKKVLIGNKDEFPFNFGVQKNFLAIIQNSKAIKDKFDRKRKKNPANK